MIYNYYKISIKSDTKELFDQTRKRLISELPKELEGLNITEDFIMKKLCQFYMKFRIDRD